MFLRWLEVAYRKSCASSLSSSYLQTTSQDKCFCSASSYSPGERNVYSQGKLVERTTSVIQLSLQAISAKRDFSLCVCVCITSSLSFHLLMDTCVASISWLLYIKLLWTLRCMHLSKLVFLCSSNIYSEVELLDTVVVLVFICWGTSTLGLSCKDTMFI